MSKSEDSSPTTAVTESVDGDDTEMDEIDVEKGEKDEKDQDEDSPSHRNSLESEDSSSSEEESESSEDEEEEDHTTSRDPIVVKEIESGSSTPEDLSENDEPDATEGPSKKNKFKYALTFFILTLQSIGIIYGDIGTSPLYVYQTIFSVLDNFDNDDILGAQSLIIYTLIFVVCIKYIIFILSVNAKGEGGVLALGSLIPGSHKDQKQKPKHIRVIKVICTVGSLLGCCFLISDGALTPAISVLSAIEGLNVVDPNFSSYEQPIGIAIIVLIFMAQRFGTSKVGFVYGPITTLWFLSIGAIGITNIVNNPDCLKAWNPYYIILFYQNNGVGAYKILGSVVLAVTGVEALYADLGHFGVWPIRCSWSLLVFPSLALAYFGHAASLMSFPERISNVFFLSMPTPVYWPMIVLATAAAIIASQAIISGCYSLISQAILLDCFPSVDIIHTNTKQKGQIYIPAVNWPLMLFTVFLIVYFKNSTAMGSAYAVAVTGCVSITTILFTVLECQRHPRLIPLIIPLCFCFLVVDLLYFSSCLIKVPDGGWVTLFASFVFFLGMISWWIGRRYIFFYNKKKSSVNVDKIYEWVRKSPQIHRTPGVGVFIEESIPKACVLYKKITQSIPEICIILHLVFYDIPKVKKEHAVTMKHYGEGIYHMKLRLGFKDKKMDVEELIDSMEALNRRDGTHHGRITYFGLKESLVNKKRRRFWMNWQTGIYNTLGKLSSPIGSSVAIPQTSVVEMFTAVPVNSRLKHPANAWEKFWNV